MEWDEYGNIIPFGQQRASQPQEWDESGQPAPHGPPPGYTDAAGGIANFNQGLTFGFADEMTGAIGGSLDALQGGSYREGYDREAGRTRAYRDQFLRDQWLAGNALQGVGAAVPAIGAMVAGQPQAAIPGGFRAVPQAAARGGLGGLTRRSAESATVGAGLGYAYGAGNADGQSLEERMLAGNDASVVGGFLGAAIPPSLAAGNQFLDRVGRPAWQGLTGAARNIPVPDPNSVGAMGRPMRRGRVTPNRPPERMDPAVGGTLERLANRSRQTPEQIERRLGEYRLNPQGEVLADAFDTPGVQTLRSMTQAPGQTGHRAADVARRRFTEAPERILTDLNRRMAVAETPEQAMAALDNDYRRISAELFEPLFAQQITPKARARLMQRFEGYQSNRVMQDAASRAQRIFELDRANGIVQGTLGENMPRFLHYMKMGLDDAAFAARMPDSGIGRTELRGIQEMRVRFIGMLDEAIPNYRAARQEWGGRIEAEVALEQGAVLLNQNSASIRQYMNGLSPFARYHARVGFANAVANRIGLRGSVVGNRNVADALGSPEMQRRVAAMFESPEEAASFLDVLNQQNMLMRNAQGWNGGSSTAANLAHGDDNATNALEAGIDLAQGRRTSAASRIRNTITGGMQERTNNRVGEQLLRRVDSDADFAAEVVAELRRREAARLAQAQAGRVGGAIVGSQQGDR